MESISKYNRIEFGNIKRDSHPPMAVGSGTNVKFLVNIGHMSDELSLDDEKRKVEIAFKNGFDIIADNSISSSADTFRRWIVSNYPMKLNSVPVYQCFHEMQTGTFEYKHLNDAIHQHIESGVDMIVVHPGLTSHIAGKVADSNRIVPLTSRGGAQIFSYMREYNQENPYYSNWDEVLDAVKRTGVCLALGLTLRAGSIVDEFDDLYLQEMDVCGSLIERARRKGVPVVIEGIGHVRLKSISRLLEEVNKRCHYAPIKTLGPIGSDRLCGLDNINSLISSSIAAMSGVSIIGALLRSEHLGLPNVDDYERDLRYYQILKYMLELDDSSGDMEIEKKISIARKERCWNKVFQFALFPDIARQTYYEYNDEQTDICTMCGERCAHKLVLGELNGK